MKRFLSLIAFHLNSALAIFNIQHGGKNQKDVMVQTENRFLPDPFLEMETETKTLSCLVD